MNDDIIKIKKIYSRTNQTSYTSMVVEFPIGIGEVVSLLAIHWNLESTKDQAGAGLFVAALSENPNHELNPPAGVAELQGNSDLYGMASWFTFSTVDTTGWAYALADHTLIIPLYGILRPKRQIAVFANVWRSGVTGIRGDIYYQEERPSREVVDAISRRYGKYRRT